MQIEQLVYYSEVYRLRSINAASFNLNITQQSLSKSIRTMEKECGCVFFSRSPKGLIPTPDGDRFYNTAQKILNEYSNFFTSHNAKDSATIFNFWYHSSLTYLCQRLYKQLVPIYKDYFINFQSFSDSNTISTSYYKDLDMYLSLSSNISHLNYPDNYRLKNISLQQFHIAFYCHKKSHFNSKNIANIDKFKNDIYIISTIPSWNSVVSKKFFPKDFFINYQTERLYQVSTIDAAITMLQKNHNVIFFELCLDGKPLIAPEMYNHEEFNLLPANNFPLFSLFLIYHKRHELISQTVAAQLADLLYF